MSWSTELLAAHPVDIFTPNSPATPHGVVLFLHGYDGVTLRDNVAYTAELNRHGLACVCPIGPLCWWTDRVHVPFDAHVSPLDFLKQHVPEFCRERWQLEPQGLPGALRLSAEELKERHHEIPRDRDVVLYCT